MIQSIGESEHRIIANKQGWMVKAKRARIYQVVGRGLRRGPVRHLLQGRLKAIAVARRVYFPAWSGSAPLSSRFPGQGAKGSGAMTVPVGITV